MSLLRRLLPDGFTLALLATVALATLLPCRGAAALWLDRLTDAAIALLFFLHGAKLSREAVLRGATHWRLHLTVFASTFVLFPLLGLLLRPLAHALLTPELALGLLFVCTLPSTVQSSIAFTSIAGGNVPAAVVSASLSSLLGIALTPLLVGLLLAVQGGAGAPLQGVRDIVLQLLLPFVAGHLLRPWIGGFVDRHRPLLGLTDRGTILLVVYAAFGAAVVEGLWRSTPPLALLLTLALDAALLALALLGTAFASRRLGFARADRITIVFCGSKKSLAAGVPMAKILFAGHAGGLGGLLLPLMIFHQLQLMVCAVLARRHAAQARGTAGDDTLEAD
ncbi:bile acid:sodium symporter family protein [Fulvimonas soli]|uniref:Sodium/bile acid cotransporter 7 n=1 Tax=Fulvimonas soli TaxID=155197 RepID=A0A316HRI7_9GAMM|nr:bile acid:sodium symporter family protein [Fulvimonas soli]PWK83871.1 sodium/bile acid cotransporter 7 [Fulvimonas soli]TNY25244.1 bile acid:sodium symporter [Fulvimonas soli]